MRLSLAGASGIGIAAATGCRWFSCTLAREAAWRGSSRFPFSPRSATASSPTTGSGTAADDLEGLARHLQLDRFHLVGTAAGGIVALDYALSFAQRLRSLVVANSIGGVEDQDYQGLQRRLRPPQFAALPPQLRELGPSYRAANPQGEARWIELEHLSNATRLPVQATRNRLSFSLLETITVPTLLLSGDADLYAPPPVLGLFAARIRNSRSVVIGECGHSAYWERPALFNQAILDFIARR